LYDVRVRQHLVRATPRHFLRAHAHIRAFQVDAHVFRLMFRLLQVDLRVFSDVHQRSHVDVPRFPAVSRPLQDDFRVFQGAATP
jgi:hypothetical protein